MLHYQFSIYDIEDHTKSSLLIITSRQNVKQSVLDTHFMTVYDYVIGACIITYKKQSIFEINKINIMEKKYKNNVKEINGKAECAEILLIITPLCRKQLNDVISDGSASVRMMYARNY